MSDTDNTQESKNLSGQRSKIDEINAATQSLELRQAEQIVNDDESIALTTAEERQIEAMADTEEERQELRQELLDEKRKVEVIRVAKAQVNEAVPARHVVSRPSFGPVTGSVEYHTRRAYGFLLGRKRSGDNGYIVGLFQAAADLRLLVQGYATGCPYAAWYLIQVEELLQKIRQKVKSVEQEAQALVNHATTISLMPFTSKRPSIVPLDFRVVYAFHFAELLSHYDRILRLLQSYEIQQFITHEQFMGIEEQLGTPLRRLFRLPSEWSYVGKDAVQQQTATALAAEHRMGMLPEDILLGERQPKMI
ncbi:AcaB family transcriptional regulator [Suttonella ornithocola]|uniref:Integrating conjugative element protein, PFL_4669 family n=1 Tax=Suttonella ornithocola TaxID=279832 RepID=A0A380MW76_9GAMM|nr:AcaB family transcriptional regulator [Suttonella ornithocola]SUO96815.1 integrating conjugative element protein, PFL_4669 family [Suttonella ornithocola]